MQQQTILSGGEQARHYGIITVLLILLGTVVLLPHKSEKIHIQMPEAKR
jgi:hypothetical protein